MAAEKKEKPAEETEDVEMTIDPYTGELKPVPEDADQFIEVIPEETEDREGGNYLLNEETSLDSYAADADDDAVAEQAAHYTEDEDIEDDFADRQRLGMSGRDELLEELEEHTSVSPEITGGDLDASWQTGNQSGEETVGGSVSTPDKDRVDDLGKAAGLVYQDDEPLNYDAKVLERDRNRWELNPASALDADGSPNEEPDDEEDLDDDELEALDELDEEGEELEADELDGDEELEDDELEEEEDEDYIDGELEDKEDEDV